MLRQPQSQGLRRWVAAVLSACGSLAGAPCTPRLEHAQGHQQPKAISAHPSQRGRGGGCVIVWMHVQIQRCLAVRRSMAEVAHAAEHHGHAALVGGVNHFLVAHRAAGLDDAGGACIHHHVEAVAEGEEGVARHHGALQRQVGVAGLDAGDAGGVRRLIWPAPTPMVMPPLQKTMALLLTYLATFQANSRSSISSSVGCFLVTTRGQSATARGCQPSAATGPSRCAWRPWRCGRAPSRVLPPLRKMSRKGDLEQAHVGLALEDFQRFGRELGAISTSTNCLLTWAAAAPSTTRLKAMMPPKALVGSVWKALL